MGVKPSSMKMLFSSIWRPYPLLIIIFTHAGVLLEKLPVLLGVLQSAKYILRLSTGHIPTYPAGVKIKKPVLV
jgi:hypothetical protein